MAVNVLLQFWVDMTELTRKSERFTPAFDHWLHIPCYTKGISTVTGQTAIPLEYKLGGSVVETTLPTPSLDFDSLSRAMPTGTQGFLETTGLFDSLFSVDATAAGILIMFKLSVVAANATNDEVILQWGADFRNTPGGIGIRFNNSNIQCYFFPSSNDASTLGASGDKPYPPVGEDATFMAYFDIHSDELYFAKDGDFANADRGSSPNVISDSIAFGNNPTATVGSYGFSFLSGNSGAPILQNQLNSNAGNDFRISDVWAIRCPTDIFNNLGAIFEEYHQNPQKRRPRNLCRLDNASPAPTDLMVGP